MEYLPNAILATLAYYNGLDMPLTPVEVHRFLVNPSRVYHVSGGIDDISLAHVQDGLNDLARKNILESKNGFYMLAGRSTICDIRAIRNKIADQKWKKFLSLSKWLAWTPYLKVLFASGSLAMRNTDDESDFDVLVVAQHGRLYTCRFFLWLISSMLFARRKAYQSIAPNKLCFNHYITDRDPYLAHESLYNAQTYAHLQPVIVKDRTVFDRFFGANIWINNFAYNFRPDSGRGCLTIKPSKIAKLIAGVAEYILATKMGDWLESKLKSYQQKRIADNPITYKSGGRIIFTNDELEFHPQSFERTILNRYKTTLKNLGILSTIEERDSGLNT